MPEPAGAAVAAGADLIELGVPFSDPMADGPVIQKAGEKALTFGVGMAQVLDMVRTFRQTNATRFCHIFHQLTVPHILEYLLAIRLAEQLIFRNSSPHFLIHHGQEHRFKALAGLFQFLILLIHTSPHTAGFLCRCRLIGQRLEFLTELYRIRRSLRRIIGRILRNLIYNSAGCLCSNNYVL